MSDSRLSAMDNVINDCAVIHLINSRTLSVFEINGIGHNLLGIHFETTATLGYHRTIATHTTPCTQSNRPVAWDRLPRVQREFGHVSVNATKVCKKSYLYSMKWYSYSYLKPHANRVRVRVPPVATLSVPSIASNPKAILHRLEKTSDNSPKAYAASPISW